MILKIDALDNALDTADNVVDVVDVVSITTLKAADLVTLRNTVRRLQEDLARTLPPLAYDVALAMVTGTPHALSPERGSPRPQDRALRADVEKFWDSRFPSLDVTLLADKDGNHDIERWTEVGVDPSEWVSEGVDNDDNDAWAVTHPNEGTVETFDCEDDATERAQEIYESIRDSRAGFPFAWNTGWTGSSVKYWLAELVSAGFVVYQYDGDEYIAGIDGGGYSFLDAHFAPLYLTLAAKHDWLVETDAGPRRVSAGVVGGGK